MHAAAEWHVSFQLTLHLPVLPFALFICTYVRICFLNFNKENNYVPKILCSKLSCLKTRKNVNFGCYYIIHKYKTFHIKLDFDRLVCMAAICHSNLIWTISAEIVPLQWTKGNFMKIDCQIKKVRTQRLHFDRSVCMAVIWYCLSAVLTNEQLFGKKRTCAKFQIDFSKYEELVCFYTDRRIIMLIIYII